MEDDRQHFLASLNQFEVLLVGEVEGSYFVVEYAHILVHVALRLPDVFVDVDLVAQGDASEELYDHLLGAAVRPIQNLVRFIVEEILGVLLLIRQVVQRKLVDLGVVVLLWIRVRVLVVREALLAGVDVLLVPELQSLILVEVVPHVEQLDRLLVIPLEGSS